MVIRAEECCKGWLVVGSALIWRRLHRAAVLSQGVVDLFVEIRLKLLTDGLLAPLPSICVNAFKSEHPSARYQTIPVVDPDHHVGLS